MDSSGDVIYIDVLIAINLIVNFFLLLAATRLCGRILKRIRILLGASIGAIYSLIILLPDIPWPVQTIFRAGVCILMMFAAEGTVKLSNLIRDSFVFFIVSFIFAGFALAVRMFAAPTAMIYSNGIVYLRVNALTLIIAAISAYLLTDIFFRIFRRRTVSEKLITSADVKIFYNDRTANAHGFIDTGNTLHDPLSGMPVVIAGKNIAQNLFTDDWLDALTSPIENAGKLGAGTISGFRLIPYSTVSGKGLIPVFRPEKLIISTEATEYTVENVLIGFPSANGALMQEENIILNPEILSSSKINKPERTSIK